MKITGGDWKGRNIESREHKSLRPTTGKVRAAIFNILRHGRFLFSDNYMPRGDDLIVDQKVIDIFCGTGILGLECLSRGATHATLIDQDSKTIDITRKNVRHLNANATVMRSDSTRLPRAPHQCTLAFMDPPYQSNLVIPALKSLRDQGWLADGALVIIEHGKQEDITTPPEGFVSLDTRLYNKTRLTIMQYRAISL